ncbi:exonuclease domain-containing protein [Aquisalimonas lutea]|uniref:exonuclease domain-containing protein n=1 Tax=Aquisalimonas lutea TaxID=1327750 RepID=UPI0025B5AD04|nr:exonuclease domain-containing protein [Aquisalimonas lutea]MDN3517029.1 exonuclease domain-containing protein [Aquisalimonas lutea]
MHALLDRGGLLPTDVGFQIVVRRIQRGLERVSWRTVASVALHARLSQGFIVTRSSGNPGLPAPSATELAMYAVVDTETTGLSPSHDRIIELAVIGLDAEGSMEWEWCSLINPGHAGTGHGLAVQVHQIYPRDVADAPTFADFAGYISRMLSGRALIGHNARFDLGMLAAEFQRLHQDLPEVPQICTSNLARDLGFRPYGLKDCCDALCIDVDGTHHALADARATAHLARVLVDFSSETMRSEIATCVRSLQHWPQVPVVTETPKTRPIPPVRGRALSAPGTADSRRSAENPAKGEDPRSAIDTFSIAADCPESRYLSAVEWVLEDREISPEQKQALSDLRAELNLSDEQVHNVHMAFIRGLAGSMWADDVLSNHEQFDLDIVGGLLNLSSEDVEYARDNPIELDLINEDYILPPGAKVVFTGEMSVPRSDWTARAKAAGLHVTGTVSGNTDYLVVPFGDTGSSKSRKARGLGVRVVSEQRFRRMIERAERESSSC